MTVNEKLDQISCIIHKRTGYSIIHMMLEVIDAMERKNNRLFNFGRDADLFFAFNSDEWIYFCLFIDEACKGGKYE